MNCRAVSYTHLDVYKRQMLAFSVTGAVQSDLRVSAISGGLKNAVVLLLTLLLTIFCGVLSMQSFVTSASDNLAMKTGKLLIGNMVPIVEGAVSDACLLYTSSRLARLCPLTERRGGGGAHPRN